MYFLFVYGGDAAKQRNLDHRSRAHREHMRTPNSSVAGVGCVTCSRSYARASSVSISLGPEHLCSRCRLRRCSGSLRRFCGWMSCVVVVASPFRMAVRAVAASGPALLTRTSLLCTSTSNMARQKKVMPRCSRSVRIGTLDLQKGGDGKVTQILSLNSRKPWLDE